MRSRDGFAVTVTIRWCSCEPHLHFGVGQRGRQHGVGRGIRHENIDGLERRETDEQLVAQLVGVGDDDDAARRADDRAT